MGDAGRVRRQAHEPAGQIGVDPDHERVGQGLPHRAEGLHGDEQDDGEPEEEVEAVAGGRVEAGTAGLPEGADGGARRQGEGGGQEAAEDGGRDHQGGKYGLRPAAEP